MSHEARYRDDVEEITEDYTSDDSDYDEHDRSSYESERTYSTAKTVYSMAKPTFQRGASCFGRVESHQSNLSQDFDERRASVETYASTEPSDIDEDDASELAYELLDFPDEEYRSDAIPATPRDFADLFPSSRRLSISHDDSTIDGNMNLRVDTLVETEWSSRKQNLTLFHLKMNDLKSRGFSLRRYCRDSGREVCKTIRKYQKPPSKQRPALTKSFSNAFNSMRRHNDEEGPHLRHLKRNDSGYGSVFGEAVADDASVEETQARHLSKALPSNTIKFEFSNYANVELKRRGAGSNKVYQFEYWGHDYTWKRKVKRDGDFEEVSFHLTRKDKPDPLAHIVPVPLTKQQAREEQLKGGWVPPCSMWITDADILSSSDDHADLVVATGLLALVDDTIKRRWHSSTHRHVLLPLIGNKPFRLNMEYIGPKRLIDEVFNRRPTSRDTAV